MYLVYIYSELSSSECFIPGGSKSQAKGGSKQMFYYAYGKETTLEIIDI